MIRRRRAVSTAGAAAALLVATCGTAGSVPTLPTMPTTPALPAPDLVFRMRDGAALPARIWRPPAGAAGRGTILALHGFTDSRDAWEVPAPVYAAAGWTVIAPDQRGFGGTESRGTWAGWPVMVDDAAELAARLRADYPGPRLVLEGESMGAAVAMCLAARAPRTADAYVLLSPAVWGRAQMPVTLRSALWAAARLAPGWRLSGQEVPLDIAATDNRDALLRLAHDPLTLRGATVAMLRGLVDLMDAAQDSAARLPDTALVLAGRRDQVVPPAAMAAAWAKLPPGVRRGLYLNGYHLLTRDLAGALVQADVLAWLNDSGRWLPSGADINAAAWQADHAWQGDVSPAAPADLVDGTGLSRVWPY